ncbi:MAG: response regulator [Pseudomonadota bacterium]
MRDPSSNTGPEQVPSFPYLLCVGLVAAAGGLSHPGLWSLALGANLPPYVAAAPVGMALLVTFVVLRPALARARSVVDLLVAERDGTRGREMRLKDELQLAELALKKAEAAQSHAEAAAAARSKYLAAISHQVRVPLSGVTGMSDLLSETKLDDEQAALVDTVRQSADDLQSILSGVLDFSALESAELTLEDAPYDIREAAEEAVLAEVAAARKKGIELVFDAPPDLPTEARGDKDRVKQMIAVLVSNAVKFTQRGEVVVSLRGVDRAAGAEMEVSVKDTGIGIPEADRKKIFAPFSQGDARSVERYGGTGLGLAIASKLAALMSGQVSVKSTPGEGSTFTLRFAHRLRQTARGNATRGPDLSGQRFLVVDDCTPAADVLARQLSFWGATVESVRGVEDGEDALWDSMAGGPQFSAMFLDLSLSGIDATALAARISEKIETLPLVLMSPQDPKGARAAVAEGIGVAALEKPFRTENLEKALVRIAEAQADRIAETATNDEAAPKPPRRQLSRPLGPVLQPACIILADDNATNRTLIEKFLADEPMTLIHAPDGVGAVEAFGSWAPDLILMDVSMPRMDGLEATRKIRAAERAQGLARVPIIALTARAMADDRAKCIEAGMDDYVTKPIRKAELKVKITEWTGSRRMTA